MGRSAVFLDRDGTIAKDVNYCCRLEDFEILPTVPEAIGLLNVSDIEVVVITNQSGIARGYFTKEVLEEIHEAMRAELASKGAHLAAVLYCPHHPDEGCACRKPRTALFHQAMRDLGIDFSLSYVVGDRDIDILAGKELGCRTVLVTTGPDRGAVAVGYAQADYVADTLYEAAKWVTRDRGEQC